MVSLSFTTTLLHLLNTVKVVLDSVFVVDVKSDANLTNSDNRLNKKQEHMLPES